MNAKELRQEAEKLWKEFDAIPATRTADKDAAMKKAAAAARKATKAEKENGTFESGLL